MPYKLPQIHNVVQVPILYLIFEAVNIKQITIRFIFLSCCACDIHGRSLPSDSEGAGWDK